jgi:hypothetical protein
MDYRDKIQFLALLPHMVVVLAETVLLVEMAAVVVVLHLTALLSQERVYTRVPHT